MRQQRPESYVYQQSCGRGYEGPACAPSDDVELDECSRCGGTGMLELRDARVSFVNTCQRCDGTGVRAPRRPAKGKWPGGPPEEPGSLFDRRP